MMLAVRRGMLGTNLNRRRLVRGSRDSFGGSVRGLGCRPPYGLHHRKNRDY